MNDTCSGCRDTEGFTYVEEQLVFEPETGSCARVWVNRCRKESTCERFKKVKEFIRTDACYGCTDSDTYIEQQFVVNPGSIGYPSDIWACRCRKESTCERFKKAKEIKMKDVCDGCIDFSDGSGFESRDIFGNKYPLPKAEGQHCVKEESCERFQRARERRYDMVDSWAYTAKVSKELDKEKEEKEKDNVNHPSHYADGCSLECIDIMESIFGPELVFDYAIVNAFKYLWRYKNKNGQEDIRKAKWYLDKAHELDNKEDFVGSRRVKYWKVQELYAKVIYKEKGKEDGEVQ